MTEKISLSIVVPVYAGENYLSSLALAVEEVRADWDSRNAPMQVTELILVDDSAIDGSSQVIDRLVAQYPWISGIHLSRNFGQHAATIAGILQSSGDWVVTMDEDLQHPPDRVEAMLRHAILARADVVYARPASAVHEAKSRDLTSKLFKRAMVYFSGNPNVPYFNSFRLIRGSIARAVSNVCGHDTYFDVGLSWFVNRVTYLEMELKDTRFITTAASSYKLSKLMSHARRMLMSSQVKLLRIMGLVGIFVISFGIILGVFVILNKMIAGSAVSSNGWASTVVLIVFFGGTTIFMVSILIEYISSLLLIAHGKPIFFVVDRKSDDLLMSYFSD